MDYDLMFCTIALLLYGIVSITIGYTIRKDLKENKEQNISTTPQVDTEKIKLLLQKDSLDNINNIVDSLIKQAIDRYMILNVNFSAEPYINSETTDELCKYTYGTVIQNMSPTMRELINLMYDVSDDDKLEEFLNLRIKIYVLSILVQTNKTLD